MPPPSSDASASQTTVYFDGSCPLCRREIALYQRIEGGSSLRWHDVSQCPPDAPGLDQAQAMARFHVRDGTGRVHVGAQAFVVLWRQLPGWRWLAKLASLPGVTPVLERGYERFLTVRPRLQRWFISRDTHES